MSVSIGELTGTLTLEDEFEKAFEHVVDYVKEGAHELEGIFGGVALGVGALAAAIGGVALAIAGTASEGAELKDIHEGFDRLAGSVEHADEILQAMRKGVAGTVDDIKLMQDANRALTTGAAKTAEEFGTITAASRVLSREGFGPIEQQMSTIERALATGRTRSLQYMTGVIDLKAAEETYAKSLGVTRDQLSAQGKLHADQIAIFDKLNQKINEAGTQELNFAEKMKAAGVSVKNWAADLAIAIGASPAVNKAFDDIQAAVLRAFGGSGQAAIDLIVKGVDRFASGISEAVPIVENIAHAVSDFVHRILDLNEQYGITERVFSVVKTAFNALVDGFHFVEDATRRAIKAWTDAPPWLQEIAKAAVVAAGSLYLTNKALGEIGSPIEKLANIGTSLINVFSGLSQMFGTTLPKALSFLWENLGKVVTLLGEFATGAFTGGIAELGAIILEVATGPIGIAVAAITALGVGIYELVKHFDVVKSFGVAAFTAIADVINKVANSALGQFLINLTQIIAKIAGWAVIGAGKVVWDALGLAIDIVGDVLSGVWGILKGIGGVLGDIGEGLARVFAGPKVTAALTWMSNILDKIVDAIKWVNNHLPSPTDLIPGKMPTPPGAPSNLPAALPVPQRVEPPLPTSLFIGPVQHPLDDHSVDIAKANADKILQANQSLLSKTEQLWDEYYQNIAKANGESFAAQLAGLDRWYDREYQAIENSKADWSHRNEAIIALDTDLYSKQLALRKTVTDAVTKLEASAVVGQIENIKNIGKVDEANIAMIKQSEAARLALRSATMMPEGVIDSLRNLGKVDTETVRVLEQEIDLRSKLNMIERPTASTSDIGNNANLPSVGIPTQILSIGQMAQVSGVGVTMGMNLKKGFEKGLHDIPNSILSAIEGGGNIAAAVAGTIGQSIGESLDNSLQESISKNFSGVVKSVLSGLSSMIPVVGTLIGSLVDKIMNIGGPSKEEKAGRGVEADLEKQFAGALTAAERLKTGLSGVAQGEAGLHKQLVEAGVDDAKAWDLARAAFDKMMAAEKQGPDAVRRIADETEAFLEQMQKNHDFASQFGPSKAELRQAAADAKAGFEYMRQSGQYSAEQIEKAFRKAEEAAAAAGDVAAKAWLDAHGGMVDFAEEAKNAGYETIEDLRKEADVAKKLAEYMRDSGRYSADAVADAFDKAEAAATRAMGISQKLLDQQKQLQDAVSAEAPEEVMGSIERQQRAQLEAVNKQIENQKKQYEDLGKAASGGLEDASGSADHFNDAMNNAADDGGAHLDQAAGTVASTVTGFTPSDVTQSGFGSLSETMNTAAEAGDRVSASMGAVKIVLETMPASLQPFREGIDDVGKKLAVDLPADAVSGSDGVKAAFADTANDIVAEFVVVERVLTDDIPASGEEGAAKVYASFDAAAGDITVRMQVASADITSTMQVAAEQIAAEFGMASAQIEKFLEDAAAAAGQHFVDAAHEMQEAWIAAAREAASQVAAAFASLNIHIPVTYDVGSFPGAGTPAPAPDKPPIYINHGTEVPMAEGGAGYATGPMTFTTKGNEFYAFGGEGQGVSGLLGKVGAQKSGPVTIQVFVAGKVVKEAVFDELENAPSTRDIKIIKGLAK